MKAKKEVSKTAWQLQAAKARFSELFRKARAEGPQYVTKAGKEAVVVLPAEQFEELIARRRHPSSLVEFFRNSPLVGAGLNFDREPDYGRDIEL
jgi:antitoxin Phd